MSGEDQNTRRDLISQKMGFNQMRNSIYWLQRYMKRHNLSNEQIKKILKRMGRNIGATFVKEILEPEPDLESLIKQLYQLTVHSKVKISEEDNHFYYIKDTNSALDKYEYDDLEISGDIIIVSTIAEMLERLGYSVKVYNVKECRSKGFKNSLHEYQIMKKGDLV